MNIVTMPEIAGEVTWHVTDPHEPVRYMVRMCPPEGQNVSLDLLAPTNDKVTIKAVKECVSKALLRQNVRDVFAPNTSTMSGLIGTISEFTRLTELDHKITLLSPPEPCEGLLLPRYAAFAVTPGGCSTAVLTFRSRTGSPGCIVAHAGLKSAIDMQLVFDCERSREECSVIDAMISQAVALGAEPERMMLRIFGSIPWEALNYATDLQGYGEGNFLILMFMEKQYGGDTIKICKHLHEHICLGTLLEAQARLRGVTHIEHVYPLPLHGRFPYGTHADPALADPMRYLVTVVHC